MPAQSVLNTTELVDKTLSEVFTPVQIGQHLSTNRIVCSPISINLADDQGFVTDEIISFYETMGKSGAGLVTIGATSVSPEGGSTANGMKVGPAKFEPGLRRLASAVTDTGALCSLQIFHVGAQGNTAYSGQPVLGPSPYTCPDIGIEARELTILEIERIEDDFAAAIISAHRAGFDFVELHLGHGYLLHEFLAPFFNRRADEYGGSVENRMRIFHNIVAKVKLHDAMAFTRVGLRISGNDYVDGGMTIEANRPLVEFMESQGAAYWVVSAGIYETAPQKYENMKNGNYYRYAEQLKSYAESVVIAQGGVRDAAAAAIILNNGQGDLVGMAQALIADPNVLKKAFYGQAEKILPCVECGRCRYIKRKDLMFDCVRPEGYHPSHSKWKLTGRASS